MSSKLINLVNSRTAISPPAGNDVIWLQNPAGVDYKMNWTDLSSLLVGGGGTAWGAITGVLSSQVDLQTALNGKSALAHSHTEAEVTNLVTDLAAKAATVHSHAEADVTNLVTDLAGKSPTVHVHAESDVTNLVADLALKAPLASPALTGTPTSPTAAAGVNTTQIATTAFATQVAPNASYRTIAEANSSHTAARVAGTYFLADGQSAGINGTGTLYAPTLIYIDPLDLPTVNGVTAKLRIRAQVAVNDVAPTGNFTFGLYPVTRPATSGGAGLCIYTMGTVIVGSNGATVATPAADSLTTLVGADFVVPAAGFYVLGVVTTATIATSSHVHLCAQLQHRNA